MHSRLSLPVRFLPVRFLPARFLPALSLLSLAVLAAPARADAPFATKRYEITFPDGWQSMSSLTGNDSALALMYGYSMMGYCYLTAAREGDPAAAAQLDAFRKTFAGSDSVEKVADGSATLGGKVFTVVEYKSVDSANADIRFRYYATSDGSLRFTAALIYDVNAGSALVPDLETALATLSFAGTPIRALAARAYPSLRPADHDVLGRARTLSARTRLYRLPAR